MRYTGEVSFNGAIVFNVSSPLDIRTVVNTKADLTKVRNNNTQGAPYVGLIVSVVDEGVPYMLVAQDYTVAENWKVAGGGSSTPIKFLANDSISATYNTIYQAWDLEVKRDAIGTYELDNSIVDDLNQFEYDIEEIKVNYATQTWVLEQISGGGGDFVPKPLWDKLFTVGGTESSPSSLQVKVGLWTNSYISAKGLDSSSDKKLKKDIRPLGSALDYILKTEYVSYKWKDDGQEEIGIIAQDQLKSKYSQLVRKRESTYSFSYQGHFVLIGKALQELYKIWRRDSKEKGKEIKRLKKKIDSFQKIMNSL